MFEFVEVVGFSFLRDESKGYFIFRKKVELGL